MASIYFKHLTIDNFMSYQHAEIDLNRHGNILVGGMNKNPEDSAKSNGCGKSSLFSALLWCLTGETVSGASDVANIYLTGKTEVSLTFEMDGSEYKVIRSKNPSKLHFSVNGEDKSGKGIRDTSKLLEDYLPQLTNNLLNSVIILGQGLPQRFTNNTPSGRKDVLEKLSNSEFMIEDLKDKLSNRKTSLSNSKIELEKSILSIETANRKDESNREALKDKLTNFPNIEDLESRKESEEVSLNNIKLEISNLENEKLNVESALDLKKEEKYNLSLDLNAALESVKVKDTSSKQNEIYTVIAEIKSLESEIRKLDSVKDVCPTCGQKLPNVHKIDTSNQKLELKEKRRIHSILEKELVDIENYNFKLEAECRNSFEDRINKVKNNINSLELEKEKIERDLKEKNVKKEVLVESLSSVKKEIESLNDRIEETKRDIEKLEHSISKNKDLLYNNNEELVIVKSRLDINNKMMTLIKRDFRGYLLHNIISFIEDKAKLYSTEVFGTDKLRFELSGNNINISYDGKDYSCLSGGEKQKLDVIIQFALRDMLCTFLNFSSNILVLDEITDALDSIGVEKVFNLIGSALQDVEATYIISHHVDELEIPADDEIIIIKGDDKISRII